MYVPNVGFARFMISYMVLLDEVYWSCNERLVRRFYISWMMDPVFLACKRSDNPQDCFCYSMIYVVGNFKDALSHFGSRWGIRSIVVVELYVVSDRNFYLESTQETFLKNSIFTSLFVKGQTSLFSIFGLIL